MIASVSFICHVLKSVIVNFITLSCSYSKLDWLFGLVHHCIVSLLLRLPYQIVVICLLLLLLDLSFMFSLSLVLLNHCRC